MFKLGTFHFCRVCKSDKRRCVVISNREIEDMWEHRILVTRLVLRNIGDSTRTSKNWWLDSYLENFREWIMANGHNTWS